MIDSNDLTQFQGDKYINPSDLIDLRDTADAEREALEERIEDLDEDTMEHHDAKRDLELWDEENMAELTELRKLCDDINTDETLIRDSEIEGYLEDFVNDCYSLPKDLPSFVSITIDYDELKQDYASYGYGSDTYWQRYT